MPDRDDDFTLGTTELAQAAQINFNNLQMLNPALTTNPIWHIAMLQLSAIVHRLESDTV